MISQEKQTDWPENFSNCGLFRFGQKTISRTGVNI